MLLQNTVVLMCLVLMLVGADEETAATNNSTGPVVPTPIPSGNSNVSRSVHESNGLLKSLNVDPSMIRRAMYVLIGITGVGVLYFLVRAVRMKKPQQKKKYGLLANMELDGMESDEDETLYEARSLRR